MLIKFYLSLGRFIPISVFFFLALWDFSADYLPGLYFWLQILWDKYQARNLYCQLCSQSCRPDCNWVGERKTLGLMERYTFFVIIINAVKLKIRSHVFTAAAATTTISRRRWMYCSWTRLWRCDFLVLFLYMYSSNICLLLLNRQIELLMITSYILLNKVSENNLLQCGLILFRF